jgi:diguanylate cyclase (GGDEF)-like protein
VAPQAESPRKQLHRDGRETVRLLLIEDSPEYATLVEHLLREELGGVVRIDRRASLADAKAALLGEVDCVLLDLSLPDADGLEAVQVARMRAPGVPVVVLSGDEDESVAVQAVHEGAQDYLVKRHVDGHLLGRAIRYAMERKRAELELAHRATHDPLTGLPNRAVFFDRLGITLARLRRRERTCAVLFLDLDGFKAVNDSHGHDAGDRLLMDVADRLRAILRSSDTVARFGGDEFAVLLDDVAGEPDAIVVAERIAGALAAPFAAGASEAYVAASIGIVLAADPDAAPDALVRAADDAMHAAKRDGSRWELARPRSGPSAKPSPEAELRAALAGDELRVYYQPEVSLSAGEIVGVESLLRWQHPERGIVPPGDFIPLAEETGFIVEMGEWVIEESCRQLARWRAAGVGGPDLAVSVNLSALQLSDAGLAERIERILRATGVPPRTLCLELTETTLVEDLDGCAERLAALKALGVQIGLDDFGTGYSSLAVLDRYPLDKLKIDRSFVWRLDAGERSKRVFEAVVELAHALDLRAVAEGVETEEHLAEISALGCDTAQGFLFARPQEPGGVAPLLAARTL